MKLGSLSALIGLAFLSASLLFIQSSASYSAGSPGTPVAASAGKVIIPAAALPPFDPAATRVSERDGTLIVHLQSGDSQQDLHIMPPQADQSVTMVRVIHSHHGPLMSLRLDDGCRDTADERKQDASREAADAGTPPGVRPACRRYAA